MAESKIRIKVGSIEVECEGSESFVKKEFLATLTKVSKISQKIGTVDLKDINSEGGGGDPESSLKMTTATIAAKLDCKSGPGLVKASAVKLTYVSGKEEFSRKDILREMKTAKAYYKSTYRDNLTSILNGLVKKSVLLETSNNNYAISADSKKILGEKIDK